MANLRSQSSYVLYQTSNYQSRLLMCVWLAALIILSSGCDLTSSVQVPTGSTTEEQTSESTESAQKLMPGQSSESTIGQDNEDSFDSFDSFEEKTLAIESHNIAPQTADAAVNDWLEPHYVVPPATKPSNKLFVFLPGSFGTPERQQLFTQTAALLGHHAINLTYPNSWTVAQLCARSRDPDCTGKIRREIIQGQDFSPEVQVSRANSIEARLEKVLKYLNTQYPDQGWGQYLTLQGIAWNSIIVAGHSQGGGHAAMIGKLHMVDRVVMLASPADISRRTRSLAPWLSEPGATPPERYFGFVHHRDRGIPRIKAAWEALGLEQFGSVVMVDQASPPYRNSHQLVTNVQPESSERFHGSVVTDNTTPQSGNQPLLLPVWRYLLESN